MRKVVQILLLIVLVTLSSAQETGMVYLEEGLEKDAWMLYPYRPGQVYEIITEMAFITTLELAYDETEVKEPALGEGTMFSLAQGSGYDEKDRPIIVLYIKPQLENIATNAVITTNKRQYHLLLRESRNEGHMFRVKWIYPDGMLEEFTDLVGREAGFGNDHIGVINHAQIHFNYEIISVARRDYDWAPYLVYDDGIRTYMLFSAFDVIETPVVFSVTKKQAIGLTFSVDGNYYLIPGVFRELELRVPSEKRKNHQEVVRVVRE